MPPVDHNLSHAEPRRVAPDWEKITLFAFGSFFFIVLLAIALLDRNPSKSSWYIYLWILALAAGGVAALLPGAVNVNLKPGIRASGALAVAVLVFFFGRDRSAGNLVVQGFESHLDYRGSVIDPSSSIYVTINWKLAAFDQGGSGPKDLDFGANDWRGTKQARVVRGSGGIYIQYGDLKQGDQIDVIAKGPSGTWWISNDMIVPHTELEMRNTPFAEVQSMVQAQHGK